MTNFFSRTLALAFSFALVACATVDKNGKKTEIFAEDEIPKSPASAPLDPEYVSPQNAKAASLTEYRQALSRSRGMIFNLRVMPLTEPYLRLWKKELPAEEVDRLVKEQVVDRTCFRFEYDTFDKGAAKTDGWEAIWTPGLIEEKKLSFAEQRAKSIFADPEPFVAPEGSQTLVLTFDADSIEDADKKRSLLIRGSFCSASPLDLSKAFTLNLIRKYEKKPSPARFEWTEWKPGISQAPTRKHW